MSLIGETTYTMDQIDEKLEDLKNKMVDRIDKTIVLTEPNAPTPDVSATSLWIEKKGPSRKIEVEEDTSWNAM